METLLIIDGNNLLFQMFYGMPTKIYNKSGKTIHATIGFISFVLKQIKLLNATKVAVVFDEDSSLDRTEEYEDYKSNRNIDWNELDDDEIPFNEEEYIVKCLKYLGVEPIYSKNMEADDVIASLTKLFEKDNKVIVSSFDSDFFQLINDNVSILRYRGKNSIIWDKNYFYEKFNFEPSKYVLYKSIVGDVSDNIKGVCGVGKVKGTYIAKKIETIDDISNIDEKIFNLVNNNIDIVKRNEKLIRLEYKDTIIYKLKDFCFNENVKLSNSQILSACNVFD